MCGIFGSFNLDDKNLMKQALRLMRHRGPDSEGIFIDSDIMFGVRRLSIIDLKTGDQPVFNEDKTIVTVFNGEIYNYKELKLELERKGHRFYTETDTEVIVHCYEEYGCFFAEKLNGMFSIAIWDSKEKKLLLYRDRFGEKPLYYFSGECFIFSSEIKPILSYDEIIPEFNINGLPHYLKYRYFKNPDTFIRQIKKVVPGTFLEISKSGVCEKRYYSLSRKKSFCGLAGMIDNSVNLRLRSDVPVGLFLSGGIDSSTILHFMKKKKENIKTFTIGFENRGSDNDLENARYISELYRTDHKEIIVSVEQAIRSIDTALSFLEEPVADATIVSSYLVSKAASEKIKVVLAGEGADEVFGGYNYYKNMQAYYKFKPLKPFAGILKFMPQKILDKAFNYPGGIGKEGKKRILSLAGKSDYEVYDDFITLWNDYKLVLKKEIPYAYIPKKKNIFEEMFYRDITGWLPDYILARTDKMAMANSLECRSPFLDHRIVDSYGGRDIGKSFLKKEMKGLLPKKIIQRKKFPFFTPLNDWFSEGMKEYYEETIDGSEIINKLFDKEYIDKIMGSYKSSPLINSRKLWSLVTLAKTTSGLNLSY